MKPRFEYRIKINNYYTGDFKTFIPVIKDNDDVFNPDFKPLKEGNDYYFITLEDAKKDLYEHVVNNLQPTSYTFVDFSKTINDELPNYLAS